MPPSVKSEIKTKPGALSLLLRIRDDRDTLSASRNAISGHPIVRGIFLLFYGWRNAVVPSEAIVFYYEY